MGGPPDGVDLGAFASMTIGGQLEGVRREPSAFLELGYLQVMSLKIQRSCMGRAALQFWGLWSPPCSTIS